MRSRVALGLVLLAALAPVAAACEGLSPGDQLVADGSRCTLSFLLAGREGLYFATAGHCIAEGSRATSPGVGAFGTAVFSFDQDAAGRDFALILVDADRYASLNPRLCSWGGPTGIYRTNPGSGDVRHHGWGVIFGDLEPTRAREGTNLWYNGGASFTWTGAAVPGDSGSAIITADGQALGVVTHVGLFPGTAGTNAGTHLDAGFALAAERGFELRLVLEGEDPLAVLAAIRGEAPAPTPQPSPTTPTPPTPTPSPSSERPPPSNETNEPPRSGSVPGATDEPLEPAAAPGDSPVPTPSLALLALAVAAAFVLRRRSA